MLPQFAVKHFASYMLLNTTVFGSKSVVQRTLTSGYTTFGKAVSSVDAKSWCHMDIDTVLHGLLYMLGRTRVCFFAVFCSLLYINHNWSWRRLNDEWYGVGTLNNLYIFTSVAHKDNRKVREAFAAFERRDQNYLKIQYDHSYVHNNVLQRRRDPKDLRKN